MWKHLDRSDSAMSADSLEVPPSTKDKYPKQVHMPIVAEHKKLTHSKQTDGKNYLILNRKPKKSKTYLEKFREKLYKKDEDEEIDVISIEAVFGDSEMDSVMDDTNIEEFFETECYNEIVYRVLINGRDFGGNSVESVDNDDVKTDPPATTTSRMSYTSTSICTTSRADCMASCDVSSVDCSSTRRPARGRNRDMKTVPSMMKSRTKSSARVCTASAASCDVTSVDCSSTRRPARDRHRENRAEHDKAKDCETKGTARESISRSSITRVRGSGMGDVPVCRLGGLGPDLEAVRPRLERARSVQRYSEQVRLDNKIRLSRHKSLSNTRTANKETNKCDTATKKQSPVNEKSIKNTEFVDKKRCVKKTTEGVKSEGAKRQTRDEKLGKKERETKKDRSRGDNGKDQLFSENIDLNYGFQLDRSCDVYKSELLRMLEERHNTYRDAVSDLYRDRQRRERPRAAAATRRRLPLP